MHFCSKDVAEVRYQRTITVRHAVRAYDQGSLAGAEVRVWLKGTVMPPRRKLKPTKYQTRIRAALDDVIWNDIICNDVILCYFRMTLFGTTLFGMTLFGMNMG